MKYYVKVGMFGDRGKYYISFICYWYYRLLTGIMVWKEDD